MHRGTGRLRAPAGLTLRVFSLALLALLLLPLCALSDEATEGLEIVIEGVPAEMADNIRAHVTSSWSTVTRMSSRRSRARYRERATQQAMIALRPFGVGTRAGRHGKPWRPVRSSPIFSNQSIVLADLSM